MKASYPIYLRQVMLLERPQSIRPAMSKRYWRKDWRRRLCFGFPDRISCSTVRLDPLPIHRYTETNLLNVSIVRTPPMIPESIPNNIAPQHAYDSLFRQYHHKKPERRRWAYGAREEIHPPSIDLLGVCLHCLIVDDFPEKGSHCSSFKGSLLDLLL